MKCLFYGGRVVDPSQDLNEPVDILTDSGVVAWIGRGDPCSMDGVRSVDLTGKIVIPGLIDPHVHFREPGQEHKETIETGCHAAAAGGFTSVVAMANTSPTVESVETLRLVLFKGRKTPIRFRSVASVTKGLQGLELTPMEELAQAGAAGFSDDGLSVVNPALMLEALERAASLGLPVSVHCEDPSLWGDRSVNRGDVSRSLGLRGVPAVAEELMIQRDIYLAETAGVPVHIQHVSSARGVALIAQAKERGVLVSAEATPHHLTLTDESVLSFGTQAKMSPPLRTSEDVECLRKALRDGVIDIVATDHAPHSADEKARGLGDAPNGVVGLETAVPVILTDLVHSGVLSLSDMVRAMSCAPARIFGIEGGTLRPGAPADLTVIDLDRRWTLDAGLFKSKGRNTPFHGKPVQGAVAMTVVGGRVVYRSDG